MRSWKSTKNEVGMAVIVVALIAIINRFFELKGINSNLWLCQLLRLGSFRYDVETMSRNNQSGQ